MNTSNIFFPLLSFIPALLNAGIALYIILFLPKGKTTDIFTFFVIALLLWQVDDTVLRISVSAKTANFWDRVLCIGYMGLSPLAVHFAVRYASLKKWYTRTGLILIYAPFILFYLVYLANNRSILVHDSHWGWINIPRPHTPDGLQRYFISAYIITAVCILFRHAYRMRKDKEKKVQAFLIAAGMVLPVIQGNITQLVFPLIMKRSEIPVTSTFMTFFSVATIIALNKYRLFNISESIQVETVLQSFRNMVFILSKDKKLIYMNPHAKKILTAGSGKDETFEIAGIFPSAADFKAFERQVIRPSMNGKICKNYPASFRTNKGTHIDVLVSSETIINNRQLQGVLFVATDITEHLKILKQLESSNERYQYATQATSDAIWDWDLADNRIYWGYGFEELFGHRVNNIKTDSASWTDFIHPEDKARVLGKIYLAISSEQKTWSDEYRFQKADGEYVFVSDKGLIIRDEHNQAIRMVGAMQDITPQKQHVQEIMRIKESLHREITNAVIIAQDKQRQAIGAELHDNVNQILATSLLYLKLAKNDFDNRDTYLNEATSFIKSAIEETRKLSHSLIPPSLNADSLVEAVKKLIVTAEKTGLQVNTEFKDLNEKMLPEKLKLTVYRIIQEQFNNIFKYSNARFLWLEISRKESAIILSIKDDGVGFDTSKKTRGVGLINMRTRASLHNGEMEIISAEKQGCHLLFTFPVN